MKKALVITIILLLSLSIAGAETLTKDSLITDLAAMDGAYKVGTPTLLTTTATGAKWYSVQVFELSEDGRTGKERSIHFYVIDEGAKTEQAVYKDTDPATTLKFTLPSVATTEPLDVKE